MRLDEAFAELKLVQDFIPAGHSNRSGRKLVPRFITIHNTDNASAGANAAAHAKYQKGQHARNRRVSWHFTVDDKGVFQSLPTSEVGSHAGSSQGNASSIGIEICMHAGMDEAAAYRRAALLVAVLGRRLDIAVPEGVVQHHRWSGKHCPRVLRDRPQGWQKFLHAAADFADGLQDAAADDIEGPHDHDDDGVDDSPAPPVPFDHRFVNARHGLRLRAGPGTDFEIVQTLAFGTRVAVVSRFGDWCMVDLGGDGAGDGFVHSAFLRTA